MEQQQPQIIETPKAEPHLLGGTIGAAVAGVAGMLGWYFLIKITNYEIGFAAWGVGLLTGLGTRVFAKGGSSTMGFVAGAFAFLAIIGGQYLAARSAADKYISENLIDGVYERHLAYAKEGVKAKTDDEIRAFLAKQAEKAPHQEAANSITQEEIDEFRKELPDLEAFANGKPSKAEYEDGLKKAFWANVPEWEVLKHSVGIFTLLWLFLGVGSAYKLAASEG